MLSLRREIGHYHEKKEIITEFRYKPLFIIGFFYSFCTCSLQWCYRLFAPTSNFLLNKNRHSKTQEENPFPIYILKNMKKNPNL